jgi:hypothetical protein
LGNARGKRARTYAGGARRLRLPETGSQRRETQRHKTEWAKHALYVIGRGAQVKTERPGRAKAPSTKLQAPEKLQIRNARDGLKLQAPNSKLQRSSKSEAPNSARQRLLGRASNLRLEWHWFLKFAPPRQQRVCARLLEFGAWSFSGAWSLELGAWCLEFGAWCFAGFPLFLQPLQQLPMNPIEPAVAEDGHHVLRFQQRHELLYNMSGVRLVKRRPA